MPCRASACAPPERVVLGGAGALARVQHDQPQGAVAAEHHPQVSASHQPGLPALGLERERPVLGFLVVAAVPDEVQHMVFAQPQRPLQRSERPSLQPIHLNHAPPGEVIERALELAPLFLALQPRLVIRGRDHRQDPQRRADRERLHRSRHLHIPHQRDLAGQAKEPVLGVVQILPGDVGQRPGQPQPDPQPSTLALCCQAAVPQALTDRAGEDSLE